MKAQAKLFIPVMWFRFLSHKGAAKDQASMHIRKVSLEPTLIALKRRDVDEGSGQIVYTSYVIKVLTGKDQASMHICTVSLEPSLIALKRRLRPNSLYQFMWFSYLSYMNRRTCTCAKYRQIMLEFLSSCGWKDLLSTLEKKWRKTDLPTLVSSHAQK